MGSETAQDVEQRLKDVGGWIRIIDQKQHEKLDLFKTIKSTHVPKMNDAENEQEFKSAKAECEKQLTVLEGKQNLEVETIDYLEKIIGYGREALKKERERIEADRKALKDFQARANAHIKNRNTFNKTAPKKDQKKPLKTEDAMAKALEADEKTAAAAEKKLDEATALLPKLRALQKSDDAAITKLRILVDVEEFRPKAAGGKK